MAYHPNVIVDRRRHRWPITHNGAVLGFVKLQRGGEFVATDAKGEVVGRYPTPDAARKALLQRRGG
jgi:hypothetical protein